MIGNEVQVRGALCYKPGQSRSSSFHAYSVVQSFVITMYIRTMVTMETGQNFNMKYTVHYTHTTKYTDTLTNYITLGHNMI